MKDTTPFGFYYLDREYIEAMHTAENPHVPNADYEYSGRERKFYCGPVTNQDGVDYYAPATHKNTKWKHLVPKQTDLPNITVSCWEIMSTRK